MESRVQETITRHDKGYNCAQAVACTYCDLFGADENTVFRMTEALGLGMGCMEGTCGAVSGACVLAGLKNSGGMEKVPATKAGSYQLAAQLVRRFHEKNGSTVCKTLKGVETGKVLRSCPDCIMDAARLVEEILVEG